MLPFQVTTSDLAETDRYWDAIIGSAGTEGQVVEYVAEVGPRIEAVSGLAGAHAVQHRRRLQLAVAAHVQPASATATNREAQTLVLKLVADGKLGMNWPRGRYQGQ